MEHVVHSSNRIGALGRYFVALSQGQHDGSTQGKPETAQVKPQQKQLHVLYILNDLLHHAKYHIPNSAVEPTLSSSLAPFLVELIQLIASAAKQRVRKRTEALLKIWEEEGIFDKAQEAELWSALSSGATSTPGILSGRNADSSFHPLESRQEVYTMPSSHGDVSAPYHDLPAANMLPHITPNKSTPIRPGDVVPLKFAAGPADAGLVIAVKEFMAAVTALDTGNTSSKAESEAVEEIDELGQLVRRDETGDLVYGRSYYGWSQEFCEKMKARQAGKSSGNPDRRGSFGSSQSRSRSRSPRKRMRYESDGDRSLSRSRSGSRQRSDFAGNADAQDDALLRRGRFDRQSRSRSPPHTSRFSPTHKQPVSRRDARFDGPGWPQNIPPPPAESSATAHFGPPHHNFQPPFLGPGGVPIPPPPPPNYTGPWPPAPGAFNPPAQGPSHHQAPGGYMPFAHGGRNNHHPGSAHGGWNR